MNKPSVISNSPDILGGIPVFRGTSVPVRTMFDYFVQGHALSEFLNDFPTVSLEQATSALEECREQLLKTPRQKTVIPEGGVRSREDVREIAKRVAALGSTPSLEPGADSREAIYGDRA